MAANEEKLVNSITWSKLVQIVDNAVEALPLRKVATIDRVTGVSLVDETKVCGHVVKGTWVSCVLVYLACSQA